MCGGGGGFMPENLVRPCRPAYRSLDGKQGAPERGSQKEGVDEVVPIWTAPALCARSGHFTFGRMNPRPASAWPCRWYESFSGLPRSQEVCVIVAKRGTDQCLGTM